MSKKYMYHHFQTLPIFLNVFIIITYYFNNRLDLSKLNLTVKLFVGKVVLPRPQLHYIFNQLLVGCIFEVVVR